MAAEVAGAPARCASARTRDELFRESALETAARVPLGLAWRLKNETPQGLLALGRLHLRELWAPSSELPPPDWSLHEPEGLAGVARDLSVPTLLGAYGRGLYPFSHVLAPKWWAPAERCVLFFDEVHVSKRMRSHLKQARHCVTFDRDFDAVIKACAGRREGKWRLTWITPAIMRAYADLHDAGHAHSFEVWDAAGELVGGGYGVVAGRAFVIESQFCRRDNASKIGFFHLAWHLAQWGFGLADNKRPTPALLPMGFRLISRTQYLDQLAGPAAGPSRWIAEADPADIAAWKPKSSAPTRGQAAA